MPRVRKGMPGKKGRTPKKPGHKRRPSGRKVSTKEGTARRRRLRLPPDLRKKLK